MSRLQGGLYIILRVVLILNHLEDWFLRILRLGSRRVERPFWALKLGWGMLMLLNIGGFASPAG